jgi:hypothetical protein
MCFLTFIPKKEEPLRVWPIKVSTGEVRVPHHICEGRRVPFVYNVCHTVLPVISWLT